MKTMTPADFATASFEDLVPRWMGAVWWSGIRPALRRMLEVDLTLAELVALHALAHHPLTIAELAEMLYLSHSAASRAADRLVRDGLVSRQEDPADRRQKRLTLTAEGEALLGEMQRIRSGRVQAAFARLEDDEREQLRALIARLMAAMQELGDEEPTDQSWSPCARQRRPEHPHHLRARPQPRE
ncbi:MAG TPA: MarR family transcriptional regulator [Thermomicrobiales bacterium]|nr:MarR family transcriptional regulator [Thermomicrobiales bacterium]